MTLTESMRRAGWRECPSDDVRRAWEAKGGRWQCADEFLWQGREESHCVDVEPDDSMDRGYYRPVNPATWDYAPEGWGAVVPTEPNLACPKCGGRIAFSATPEQNIAHGRCTTGHYRSGKALCGWRGTLQRQGVKFVVSPIPTEPG